MGIVLIFGCLYIVVIFYKIVNIGNEGRLVNFLFGNIVWKCYLFEKIFILL